MVDPPNDNNSLATRRRRRRFQLSTTLQPTGVVLVREPVSDEVVSCQTIRRHGLPRPIVEAERPQDIPARGWKDVLVRPYVASNKKNLPLVAGGTTYYVLVALFPGLAALVSIYGLLADPAQVEKQVSTISGVVPGSAQKLIGDELHQLVSSSGSALSLGVVVGLLISIWSASRGMSGMITPLDIAYGQDDQRSFFKFNLVAIAFASRTVMVAVSLMRACRKWRWSVSWSQTPPV